MTYHATDAWGAIRQLAGKNARVASHVVTATAYMVAYLILRQASNDQWYLPAGLRFACLLMTPYRRWPALYAGDIAATALFRYPMLAQYGWLYYLGSALPVWPVVAAIVRQLREHTAAPLIRRSADAFAIVIAGVLSAELASLINKASSAFLKAGGGTMKYGDLIVYSLGHVQGILLATFVALLASGRVREHTKKAAFLIDAACSALICLGIASATALNATADPSALMLARLLLLAPAVTLAVRHGWRGAAFGSIASNVALFITIPHQEAGYSDATGLLMQEAFSFLSCALLVLGARDSERRLQACDSVTAARDARKQAKANFDSMESQMRTKALHAEEMQEQSRGSIAPVIAWLRKSGNSEAAMRVIGMAHMQSSQFRSIVVDGIYPLTLERSGLFAALHSEAFRAQFDRVACELDLTGPHRHLSLSTQLAAYRVIGEGMEYLATFRPERITLRVRCSTYQNRGHISIALAAYRPGITSRAAIDTARLAQLRTRVGAYDGSFHSRPLRLRTILLDDVNAAPDAISATSSGSNDHCRNVTAE